MKTQYLLLIASLADVEASPYRPKASEICKVTESVPLDQVRAGWHVATYDEVKAEKSGIDVQISTWGIVAFYGGKILGRGYGRKMNNIEDEPNRHLKDGSHPLGQMVECKDST